MVELAYGAVLLAGEGAEGAGFVDGERLECESLDSGGVDFREGSGNLILLEKHFEFGERGVLCGGAEVAPVGGGHAGDEGGFEGGGGLKRLAEPFVGSAVLGGGLVGENDTSGAAALVARGFGVAGAAFGGGGPAGLDAVLIYSRCSIIPPEAEKALSSSTGIMGHIASNWPAQLLWRQWPVSFAKRSDRRIGGHVFHLHSRVQER